MNKLSLSFFLLAFTLQAEEYNFDISSYEKPDYEIDGYIELFHTHSRLNTNSALYNLFLSTSNPVSVNNQYSAELQLSGVYRFSKNQVHFQYSAESQHSDISDTYNDSLFYQFYYTNNQFNNFTIDIGKRIQKWGKGYAWNPVGFIERKKDPDDPELSREGYLMLTGDYVQSYNQSLKTISIMPVILPVTNDINKHFSVEEDTNFAVKAYLLYRNIDIDFMFLSKGSKAARLGFDFSANLSSSFEIHGEYAYIKDENLIQLDNQSQLISQHKNVIQSLLGFRYLTENEITWIGEYYHNGSGYSKQQLEEFFKLAENDFQTSPQLLSLTQQASASGYGNINPGKDYLYLSVSKKEPFDLVYFNLRTSSIMNIHDSSYSLTPELIYSGFNNSEIRLRTSFLQGNKYSEFAEKPNDWKFDFRFRYYF